MRETKVEIKKFKGYGYGTSPKSLFFNLSIFYTLYSYIFMNIIFKVNKIVC